MIPKTVTDISKWMLHGNSGCHMTSNGRDTVKMPSQRSAYIK